MLKVRKTIEADVAEIAAYTRLAYADECTKRNVINTCPDYPSPASVLEDLDKYLYHTILLDDQIIGGLYLIEKDASLTLEDFCIHPDYQNKGYGYKVMKMLEKEYSHIDKWHLVTPVYSLGNQALYHKLNYKVMGSGV